MKALSVITFILSFTSSVLAQLLTTTNAAGITVVEQITTNALGQTITLLVQTLQATASSTSLTTSPTSAATPTTSPTTTKATTTANGQQGPVGQPAETPETPGGPTPFTYTTTDASGNYVVTTGIFTPSFPATTPFTPTGTGTVLPYSVWLSMIRATSTQGAAAQKANSTSNAASWVGVHLGLLLGAVSMVVIGLIGGSLSVSL